MDRSVGIGRILGILIILQAVIGSSVNFGLLGPVLSTASQPLANAAGSDERISLAAVLLLAGGILSIVISTTVFPVFRQFSERAALWYLGLTIAACALAAVESASVMSILTLSQQYQTATLADRNAFEAAGIVVRYGRYWAHYTHLLIGSGAVLVLLVTLYRFALVPRVFAAIGSLLVPLQMTGLLMPFFGYRVNFYLLAPMGICYLLIAIWLIVKGFAIADNDQQATRTEFA